MPIVPHRQYGHPYWAIWPIFLQLCSVMIPLDSKVNGERKEAMIARFDHRPMLTALLALSTTVLLVVVVTLLITFPPAASPTRGSSGGNPGAAAAPTNMDAGGSNYGWNIQPKAAQNADAGGEYYGWEPHLRGPR
jgi:hypothetical protein